MTADGFLYANDTPGRYPPSYYARSANRHDPFPSLDGDSKADVCVVGGGFTGISTALHLAERGIDVVLLEAHRIGWGASGRNGGQLGSGQRRDQTWLERTVGPADARRLWQLAEDAKALVRQRIERHEIACDLKPGIIHAIHAPRFGGAEKWQFTSTDKAEIEKLRNVYGYNQIRLLGSEEIRAMVGSKVYCGGSLDMGAGHIHPLNLCLGLADAARDAGARIHENSSAIRLNRSDPAKIVTPTGTVTADAVVLACNGYMDDLAPDIARHVMPINNFIAATEPLGDALAETIIRDDVAVADSKFIVNYFRLSADKRLLFGGGETYSNRFPADIEAFVRPHILKIFPQLADVDIDTAWGGTLAITMNRMPYFCRPKPHIFSAGGFSGHGVALANLSGKILADAVSGTLGEFDLMAQLPTPAFPGGTRLRHPLLILAMTWYGLRDRLGI